MTKAKSCEELLSFIKDRKLESVALVFLELYRPLAGLGDAALIFFQPFLNVFSVQTRALELLSDRSNIDWLISQIEQNDQVKKVLGPS